jgi:hypothetical protein
MRERTIDLTPVTFRRKRSLKLRGSRHREERLARALARHPWVFLLASWTLGRTYDRMVERQARRERRAASVTDVLGGNRLRRPQVWTP